MQPPHSFRHVVFLSGLSLLSCSLDGKGLGAGQPAVDASLDTGSATGTGGRPVTPATGGAPGAGTGGAHSSSGGAPGSGGGVAATGGAPGSGTGGGDGATGGAGAIGSGGAPEPGTGGAAQPGSGGAASGGAAQPGTGGRGVATGGAPQPGSGGRAGTGGAGTGGAGTGGAFATCSALTCPAGCCQNGTCVVTRTDQRCGTGGVACAPCGACFRCSVMGTCAAEETARWNLTCVSATVTPTRNGQSWDPATPATPLPDPYCQLTVDGDVRGTTEIDADTLMPVWNESVSGSGNGGNLTTAVLTGPTSRWAISVMDSDGAVDDAVCAVTGRLTPAELAAGTVVFSNKESCSTLTIKVSCAQN